MVNKYFYDLVCEEHKYRLEYLLKDAFESGDVKKESFISFTKNGSKIWIEVSISSVNNAHTQTHQLISIVSDITKNKTAQDELLLARVYERMILDSQHSLVFVTDGKDLLDANKKFLDFIGYRSVEGFLFEHKLEEIFDILQHKCDLSDMLRNFVENRDTRIELRFNGKDSVFLANAKKLNYMGEDRYIISLSEITELDLYRQNLEKKVEEEIAKRKEHENILFQQQKLAAIGEMIGAISHQLKQPLNVISLITDGLDDMYMSNSINKEDLKAIGLKISMQIDFMSNTIEEFRNFFRPDKIKHSFSLKNTIQGVVIIFEPLLKKHSISIDLSGEDFEISGFENQLKQVILNLINNAKDAIISKGLFDGKIKISIDKERREIFFEDNGGGIDENIIKHIFDKYYTTKGEIEGTGIGLHMSRVIIEESFGGSIDVTNGKNGAIFIIKLPNRVI